jgi:hypothetical protein
VELDEVFVVGVGLSAESVDTVEGRGIVGVELRREEAGKTIRRGGPVVEVVEGALDLCKRRRLSSVRRSGKEGGERIDEPPQHKPHRLSPD